MKKAFFVLFIAICSSVSASIYYVAADGNDTSGNGSLGNPWFSLQRTWNVISAGDTIYMRGGIYKYAKQTLYGKNGTEGNLIKIWAYPGEKPIIEKYGSYANTGWPRAIIIVSGNFIHIKGLEICYNTQENQEAYYGLINYNGNNNIYEQLNVHHNGWIGISIEYNSTDNLILNCDVHHNSDPLSSVKYGNADGIGFAHIPKGSINTIQGCRMWYNSDDGIDTYGSDSKLIIENCWSWYNGYIPDSFNTGGDGCGFKLGKSASDWGNEIMMYVSGCVAYKNRRWGFHQNGAIAAMELHNNTAYLNGSEGFWFGNYNKPHIVTNNISYLNASYCYLTTSSLVSHNNFLINDSENPDYYLSDEDFSSLDASQLNAARKADGNLPDIDFLHLVIGSDLVDAGIDAGMPYYGQAPDIGAFEVVNGIYHVNQPPVVSISSPTKGVSYSSLATIAIDIEAYDPDGSISKVELYNDSEKLGELTDLPYSFTLKDIEAGYYSLYAVAIDNLSSSTTSESLEFYVTSQNGSIESFNLYPNPNNGYFSINFNSTLDIENYIITVCSLVGRTVYRTELSREERTKEIDLSYLNPGIYIFTISTNKILLTQKFIKN